MRKLIVAMALVAVALTAAGAADTTVVAAVDTTLMVLPTGDTVPVLMPVPGPMPTDITDVEGLLSLFNWVYIVLFIVVGLLKDMVPGLRNIDDKELALLAFFIMSVIAVVAFKSVFGEGVTAGDAVRLFISAAAATRIYAWGIKYAPALWRRLRGLVSKGGTA